MGRKKEINVKVFYLTDEKAPTLAELLKESLGAFLRAEADDGR